MKNLRIVGMFALLGMSAVVSVAKADPPLKSGDRVVFLGDSITEQKIHTRYVMNYFTLRYPGLDVTFRNAGMGGDSAGAAWAGSSGTCSRSSPPSSRSASA